MQRVATRKTTAINNNWANSFRCHACNVEQNPTLLPETDHAILGGQATGEVAQVQP